MHAEQSLKGKVAFVTGASRGIGAAIARELAREGAKVALTYVASEERAHALVAEIEAAGGQAMAFRADSADAAALMGAIDAVVSAWGAIDILVNNAGVFPTGLITDVEVEELDRTLAINVRGPFVAIKAVAAQMPEGGRIVTIGSNLALRVPGAGMSLYAMSKAALVGLTKGAARDLGARQITVNIVHPGSTRTDMNPADGEFSDAQRVAMAIPRYNEPGDVAGLVVWLAGPRGRSVTGAEFTIDGGTNA